MALQIQHKETKFGVGDEVKVYLKVKETDQSGKEGKTRNQIFQGIVISIKGKGNGKTFRVRRIGSQKIGIEMIFPINTPSIDKVEVVRRGLEGVRQSKLYYIRNKSTREIEKIYARASRKKSSSSNTKDSRVL
jgi:large subunit ribosomal protein L19